tara:strand:- start:196 stop:435 length:240 start_codon:yes stop_codon:yes gene_type:complete
MKTEIAQLLQEKKPLPKGTRIVSKIGYTPIGGTHELDETALSSANRVPNGHSETDPFWIHGWRDLHGDLSIPANGKDLP